MGAEEEGCEGEAQAGTVWSVVLNAVVSALLNIELLYITWDYTMAPITHTHTHTHTHTQWKKLGVGGEKDSDEVNTHTHTHTHTPLHPTRTQHRHRHTPISVISYDTHQY